MREQPWAWAQARQAWGWRAMMGASFFWRRALRAGLTVVTLIPWRTWVRQAGWGSAWPATSTTHRPQPVKASSLALAIFSEP